MAQILVCDDESLVRSSLAEYLTTQGFEATQVADGAQCIQELERAVPDVLLLDLVMPNMDGLSVLRHIRKMNIDLPVVMVTAHGAVDSAIEATRLGALGYIQKPFDMGAIVRQINQILADKLRPIKAFVLPEEGVDLESVEKSLIMQALERTHQNQSKSARILGITRFALRYRMEKYGLFPAPKTDEPRHF